MSDNFFDFDEISRLSQADDYPEELSVYYASLQRTPPQRYRNHELIGEGALKNVYSCYDERTRSQVAYASPRPGLSTRYYDYFIYEAWLTASLKHPNIIKVYDLNLDKDGVPFFTMDLKQGKTTLQQLVVQGETLSTTLEVLLKVCDALSYAHAQHIIHLDLKPENILCDAYGEVLLCDWGIGKVIDGRGPVDGIENVDLIDVGNTLHGQIKGTAGYMSPEQACRDPKDERSDIFALGALLYYLSVGHAPFTGDLSEMLQRTREADWDVASLDECKLPRELQAVIKKALQREPADRYSSVTAFQQDLSLYLAGYRTRAERPTLFHLSYAFLKRHRSKVVLILILSALTAFVAGYYQVQNAQLAEQKQAREEENEMLNNEKGLLEAEIDSIQQKRKDIDRFLWGSKGEKVISFREEILEQLDPLYYGNGRDYKFQVQRAEQIAKLQDGFQELTWFSFYTKIVKMDFQSAHDDYLAKQETKVDKVKFLKKGSEHVQQIKAQQGQGLGFLAHNYLDYSYNQDRRPDAEWLVRFFSELRSPPQTSAQVVMSMLRYSLSFKYSRVETNQILFSALDCLIGEQNGCVISYQEKGNRATITFSEDYNPDVYDSALCLLSYLQLHQLQISSALEFNLLNLSGASLLSLDLSACPEVALSREMHIYRLQNLTLPADNKGDTMNAITSRLKAQSSKGEDKEYVVR